jgi:protein-tyrosine-phosphatase
MIDILFVCTGNICRSPMAEALLRQKLRDGYPRLAPCVRVSSAGISAIEGTSATNSAIQAMDLWGIDLEPHAASSLSPGRLRDADLILAMAREHLLVIGRLSSEALRKSTTLKSLAFEGEAIAKSLGLQTLLDEAEARRRLDSVLQIMRERHPGQEFLADMQSVGSDIIDPIGSSLRIYIGVLEDIEKGLGAIMPALFGHAEEERGD